MQIPQATAEHHWLQRLTGHWTVSSECRMRPDDPPFQFSGTEVVRSLGELWVLAEGTGSTPDIGCDSVMTLGYDPRQQAFTGTFVGSKMTHLWLYRGQFSVDGQQLILEAEGPDFSGTGTLTTFRDIIQWVDENHRRMTSLVQNPDGQWQHFMTTDYLRQPAAS